MPFLELRALGKSFGDNRVLADVGLAVDEGEVLALLGPSGSGKTTLLRLLAGFERPSRGEILVDGEDLTRVVPAQRGVGMVFQHYALFPHLSVGENVAFGLHGRGLPAHEQAERVAEVLELVDLAGFEDRAVTRISGGQQQRVALARAIAPEPRLLLLDEPLSNLDPELRERTRRRLRAMLSSIGVTTILVTHEQDEAFDLGDRVAVLSSGRLQQIATPEVLYRQPANRFVAGFIGRSSFLDGTMGQDGTVVVGADSDGEAVVWPGEATGEAAPSGQAVELAVRPEAVELVPVATRGALPGKVAEARFTGMVHLIGVELDGGGRIEVAAESSPRSGAAIAVARRSLGPPPRIFRRAQGDPA